MQTTLAILPNWVGDLVMSLPALAALRHEGRVAAVGAPHLMALLEDAELIDVGVYYERRGADRGMGGLWRVARRCRSVGAERAIVFPPSLRAAAIPFLAGIRRRRGYRGEFRGALLNDSRARRPRSEHLCDQWLALAVDAPSSMNPTPSYRPGVRARAEFESLRERFPAELGGDPYLAIAPGASFGPTKRWPRESFIQLARALRSQFGFRIVVVGSDDPDERSLCGEIADSSGGVNLAGHSSLLGLAAILERAVAFVGNDSGPMHLAAAVGTATVGIFGSTSPNWTAPRGVFADHVGPADVDCSPCFRSTCDIGITCLADLPVDSVLVALRRLLARPQHPHEEQG